MIRSCHRARSLMMANGVVSILRETSLPIVICLTADIYNAAIARDDAEVVKLVLPFPYTFLSSPQVSRRAHHDGWVS